MPRLAPPHPAPLGRVGRRGHALVEALIAMTVLLLCSAMIGQTTLSAMRMRDAWQRRITALDSLAARTADRWLRQCAGWSPPAPPVASTGPHTLDIGEFPHPVLDTAGLLLHARWVGLPSDGARAHGLSVFWGVWCGA